MTRDAPEHVVIDASVMVDLLAGTDRATSARTRIDGTILYGPGQNLAKMQGLISHLGRTLVSGSPLGVYVPIDTIRDYLYADDCAAMALAFVETAEERDLAHTTKILASGNGVTIGELIGLLRHLTKRKPHVIYAASKLASAQSSDLRLRSMVLPELNAYATTPLPVGVSATVAAFAKWRAAVSASSRKRSAIQPAWNSASIQSAGPSAPCCRATS